MALSRSVTELDSYKDYLHMIGEVPSYYLDRCFACGLPAVWLYMKAIGLESEYFEIIDKIKDRVLLFKELFYLLILTNGSNRYFPHVPESFLNVEIPPEVLAAQINVPKPEFDMAFTFTKEQLQETLELIAKPNKMIRIGNVHKAIGIMFSNNVYHVYHADNPRPVAYKNIAGCVDSIMRVMQND